MRLGVARNRNLFDTLCVCVCVSQALCFSASVGMISVGALTFTVIPVVDAGGFAEWRMIQ
jgi:hypothetical protein